LKQRAAIREWRLESDELKRECSKGSGTNKRTKDIETDCNSDNDVAKNDPRVANDKAA